MLVASYIMAALYLYFARVLLAIFIGVYYSFLLYIIFLVYKKPLYFIFTVLYIVKKLYNLIVNSEVHISTYLGPYPSLHL